MGMIRSLGMDIYPHLPPFLKDWACSYEGHKIRRQRFGGIYEDTLEFLQNSQWWSLEQQQVFQFEKLRRMLEIAQNAVPYYRDLFKETGFSAKNVQSPDDLKKLPVLKKSDIKKAQKAFFNPTIPGREGVKWSTGGTTGTPLRLLTTRSAIQAYFAVAWRQRGWFGVHNRMPHATFNGRTIVPRRRETPPFWCRNFPARQTLFSIYHMKSDNLQQYAEELARCPRNYLTGYPSSLHIMAAYLLDRGIELPWRPKAIFTSSETLLENQRKAISQAFQAPVADFYGLGEQCVAASQCPCGLYHFDFEVGIVEVLPVGDDPLVGKLVCTGLVNEAMPLIRYDTEDVVRLSEKECACGRKGLVAESVDGRIDSYIKTPEGLLIGRLAHIFKDLDAIQETQIIQTKIDGLLVKVVKAQDFCQEDENKLRNSLRQRVGNAMNIQFQYLDKIPRESNGKFRAVVSKLKEAEIKLQ